MLPLVCVDKAVGMASVLNGINKIPENDKPTRKEMAKLFQRANRRIQNIERAMSAGRLGYSPAYDSVMQYTQRPNVYSKFHMVSDWSQMIEQTAQAEAFLNEPTSTARGARKWQKQVMRGVTRRNGEPLTEKEISRFMRSVYGSGYGDSRFQSIAERYVLGNTEIYTDDGDSGFYDMVDSIVDSAGEYIGGSLLDDRRNKKSARSIGKALTKFRKFL